jgi:hypothetical protein
VGASSFIQRISTVNVYIYVYYSKVAVNMNMRQYDLYRNLKSVADGLSNPDLVAEKRKTALRTEENGWIVDTCVGFDTGIWETGIERDSKGFIITEQYADEVKAKEGHERYVTMMRKDPKGKLPNIQEEDCFDWGEDE